jgi:hypothetical protein
MAAWWKKNVVRAAAAWVYMVTCRFPINLIFVIYQWLPIELVYIKENYH